MSYLVGSILRTRTKDDQKQYLRSLVQPANADVGEPISAEEHRLWLERNFASFRQVGWRMKEIEIRLLPKTTRIDKDLDGSKPDPFLRVKHRDAASGHEYTIETDCVVQTNRMTNTTTFRRPGGRRFRALAGLFGGCCGARGRVEDEG